MWAGGRTVSLNGVGRLSTSQASAEETATNPSLGSSCTRAGIGYNRGPQRLSPAKHRCDATAEVGDRSVANTAHRQIGFSPGSGSDLAVTRNWYKPGSTQSTAG
jgi:hypothetical protein